MAQDQTKIAFGYGRAYAGAYVAGAPLTNPTASVARNAAWPGGWTDLGFTDGISWTPNPASKQVSADQTTGNLMDLVVGQMYQFKLNLKQTNAANLAYILGGIGALSTSGSSNVYSVSHNARKAEYVIGIEGPSPNINPTAAQRIFFLRATVDSIGELSFQKDAETVAQLTFNALVDVPTSKIVDVVTWEPTS